MKNSGNDGWKWAIGANPILLLAFMGLLSSQSVKAQGNPYDGYANDNYYTLDYSSGSFAPGNTSDVTVDATIGGSTNTYNVDTGSRGIYASITELGLDPNTPGSYAGQIQLTSSGRVSSGTWIPTTVTLAVTDKNGDHTTVDSSVNVLQVTTVSAELNRMATYQ